MGLGDYNRKRDFRITSEPAGRPARSATGNSFVVQKHAATRLHYDFRLEVDGVLKSWSVPKGPSFDPMVKRLAVEVEDHPIDYGGFEGIIPAGQYGGGTVLLWDRGTFEPLEEPLASLAAGQLKFELSGQKLRGRWVLVKIKERARARAQRLGPEGRSWLLIKERDTYARPETEWSVTEARPESVASGRDLPAIASASDRVWHSNRDRPDASALRGARAAAMPASLQLARPTRARTVPDGAMWLHEVEVIGERVQCRIDAGRARMLSASGRDRSRALDALARAAQALPARQAIIDGVATVLGADGRTAKGRAPNTLYVFDLMYLDGNDLVRVPLAERKATLSSLVVAAGAPAGVRFTDHVLGNGKDTFREAARLGAPGLVSKRSRARYPTGPARSADWRVVSCPEHVGAKAATKAAAKAAGKTAGKAGSNLGAPAGVGATVGANGRAPAAARVATGDRDGADTNVAGVRLTHPARVLYPEAGIAKLDLARFYEAVAPFMLPHIEDRPLTLVRAPDGVTGGTFYVRHAGDWAPKELRQVTIPDGSGSGTTMIADDEAGLVALAQMNVLEIHAWNARASRVELPDRLVFDLDPGPQVTWDAVVQAAVHVRAALELLDLESFVKTTGSKGLHVVVPLEPFASWTDSLEFSRTLARAIARVEPRRYSASLPKSGREDKILIDYLRNRRGATSVSVYSTRARPSAPVSTPVAWDDLGSGVRSDGFHVHELPALLRARRDPWVNYGRVRQRLTSTRLKQAASLLGRT